MTDELKAYIDNQLNSGIGEDEIRNILVQQGWSVDIINKYFASKRAQVNTYNTAVPQATIIENIVASETAGADSGNSTAKGVKNFSFIKALIFFTIILVFLCIAIALSFLWQNTSQEEIANSTEKIERSQTQLVNNVRPATVSLITTFKGDLSFKPFYIDYKNRIVDNKDVYRNIFEEEFDEVMTGSGFIVNPDGYIITNSHVVSQDSLIDEIVNGLMVLMTIDSLTILKLQGEDVEAISKEFAKDEKAAKEFGDKIKIAIRENLVINAETKTYVANLNSEEENTEGIIKDSFEAKVLFENSDLEEDQKDVALIKIDQQDLPSIKLDTDAVIEVGNDAFVFGFPGSANFNRKSLFEPSYTTGSFSSVKKSDNGDFDIYQLDAKISAGSSGGPVFNREGGVVGIITWGSIDQDIGDTFAFALPIKFGLDALAEKQIENKSGNYNIHLERGIRLTKHNHCKFALAEFDLAEKDTNVNFLQKDYLKNQKEICNSIIASHESIDTKKQEFVSWLKRTEARVWYTYGGILVFVFIVYVGYMILNHRIRKNTILIEEND